MALPIPELVTQDVVDTLKGIRKAAGYSFTINDVERVKTPETIPAAWKALVTMADPELISRDYPMMTLSLRYEIGVWCQVNESSNVAPDSLLWGVWSDVVRALMVDEHRGNHAIRTLPQPPMFRESVVVIPVEIICRFRADDPTLAA